MREYAHPDRYRVRRKYAPGSRCLVALFSLIVLPGTLLNLEYSLSQSREDTPYTISACVEMVVLNATVRDRKGVLHFGHTLLPGSPGIHRHKFH